MATATKYDISPGVIAEAGAAGGLPFVLSKTEWVTIQTYVINALALPINNDEFRKSLGSAAFSSLSDFEKLIKAYQEINGHCTTWQSTTFPKTVKLANAIY